VVGDEDGEHDQQRRLQVEKTELRDDGRTAFGDLVARGWPPRSAGRDIRLEEIAEDIPDGANVTPRDCRRWSRDHVGGGARLLLTQSRPSDGIQAPSQHARDA
jgi:hypothetical protein